MKYLNNKWIIPMIFIFHFVSCSENNNTPEKALTSFINAIQNSNYDKAFEMDYAQNKMIKGKFKSDIENIKENYKNYFKGNPSKCPAGSERICEGISRDLLAGQSEKLIADFRLFFPRSSQYEISDVVYTNQEESEVKMLIAVSYSGKDRLYYVDRLRAEHISNYSGLIMPVPPIYSGSGIVTADNSLLSVKKVIGGGNNYFPFHLQKWEIKSIEFVAFLKKVGKHWLIEEAFSRKENY